MEQVRRDNPTLAGICHFTAMDIGFSPQGIIDEFYEKKLVPAEQWKQTIGETVVMIDTRFDDRIHTVGSRFEKTSLFLISHILLLINQLSNGLFL